MGFLGGGAALGMSVPRPEMEMRFRGSVYPDKSH